MSTKITQGTEIAGNLIIAVSTLVTWLLIQCICYCDDPYHIKCVATLYHILYPLTTHSLRRPIPYRVCMATLYHILTTHSP